jgi:hypothetical protein
MLDWLNIDEKHRDLKLLKSLEIQISGEALTICATFLPKTNGLDRFEDNYERPKHICCSNNICAGLN